MLTNDFIGQQSSPYNGGWFLPQESQWFYDSADAPSYVVNIDGNMAGVISNGMRVRLYQLTEVKYFIVTAVSDYDEITGVTAVTLYGGTNYTLTSDAITDPSISSEKAPYGFPLNPELWTVSYSDTELRTQSTPTEDFWYNLNNASLEIPVGLWNVEYYVSAEVSSTEISASVYAALSTSNSTPSNSLWIRGFQGGTSGDNVYVGASCSAYMTISLTQKTTYYLISMSGTAGGTNLYNVGTTTPIYIRAVIAYL